MFRVGDRVKIKSSYLATDMMAYIGKESTIREACINGIYALEIDNGEWIWREEMLEKVKEDTTELTLKEYFETKARMLKQDETGMCNRPCEGCPLEKYIGTGHCPGLDGDDTEDVIKTVQEWGKEHPVKKLKDKLLGILPSKCPSDLGIIGSCDRMTCGECWNQPYKDE